MGCLVRKSDCMGTTRDAADLDPGIRDSRRVGLDGLGAGLGAAVPRCGSRPRGRRCGSPAGIFRVRRDRRGRRNGRGGRRGCEPRDGRGARAHGARAEHPRDGGNRLAAQAGLVLQCGGARAGHGLQGARTERRDQHRRRRDLPHGRPGFRLSRRRFPVVWHRVDQPARPGRRGDTRIAQWPAAAFERGLQSERAAVRRPGHDSAGSGRAGRDSQGWCLGDLRLRRGRGRHQHHYSQELRRRSARARRRDDDPIRSTRWHRERRIGCSQRAGTGVSGRQLPEPQ